MLFMEHGYNQGEVTISDLFRAIRNLNINVLGKLTSLCSRTRLGVAVLVMMWLACHGTSP